MSAYKRRSCIYSTEYQEDNDEKFLVSLLTSPNMKVLELPCGAGRISSTLAQKLDHLTIMDLEPEMVKIALEKLDKDGFSDKVTGLTGDICTFNINTLFDLIVVPREALQLLSSGMAAAALFNTAQHLKLNTGRLIVDLASFSCTENERRDPDYYYPSNSDGRKYTNWSRRTPDGKTLTRVSSQRTYDDRIDFTFDYKLEPNCGYISSANMIIFKYDIDWVKNHIGTNISIINVWGSYQKTPFRKGDDRIIIELARINDNS